MLALNPQNSANISFLKILGLELDFSSPPQAFDPEQSPKEAPTLCPKPLITIVMINYPILVPLAVNHKVDIAKIPNPKSKTLSSKPQIPKPRVHNPKP